MTDDSYFNISVIKLSITSRYIISDAPKYDIVWTENNGVIDSFIIEILKYESSIIESLTEKPSAVLFTPYFKLDYVYMKINKLLTHIVLNLL